MAVHAVGVACFAAQFRFLFSIVTPLTGTFGGSYQYLTILGLAGATLTYALALVGDLTLSETVFRAKNVLSVCVTPLEVLISVLYCAIVAVNRDLLIPPQYRLDALPDFGFHGMPALLLVIDLLLFSPPWVSTALADALWLGEGTNADLCRRSQHTQPRRLPEVWPFCTGFGSRLAIPTMACK